MEMDLNECLQECERVLGKIEKINMSPDAQLKLGTCLFIEDYKFYKIFYKYKPNIQYSSLGIPGEGLIFCLWFPISQYTSSIKEWYEPRIKLLKRIREDLIKASNDESFRKIYLNAERIK